MNSNEPSPRLRGRALRRAGLCLLLCASSIALAAEEEKPLQPVDTSSPRATLTSFLDEMNDAVALYRDETDLEGARARVLEAARCLDLRQVAPTVADTVGFETALRLKEVLDRIPVPSPKHMPDAAQMEKDQSESWRIPDTLISIARVAEGPRAGEYLFTSDTVARSQEFYSRVQQLPYKKHSGKGANYAQYQLGVGGFLSHWVDGLPAWTKTSFQGQALWQWGALLLLLTVGSVLAALFYFAGRWLLASLQNLRAYVLPLTLMGMSSILDSLADQIHLIGTASTGVSLLLSGVFFLGGVRLVAVVLNQIASLVISTARLRPQGVDSQLVRLAFRTLVVAVTAALLLGAADQLGLHAYSLLTGLGIGGLAIALAARDNVANFLGSVVLMIERPFRIGDWIKVGDQEGSVEDIGFRSTRLRTFYNSVVTIPSNELVSASIDNMGMRRYRRVRTTVQITYDTPSDKIEAFVEGIQDILRAEPVTNAKDFHVVLHDLGAHSLDILLYFFIVAQDWTTELAQRQRVLFEVVRLAERLGVRFAFPTQTLHVESLPDPR